jgi:hypothetical protein
MTEEWGELNINWHVELNQKAVDFNSHLKTIYVELRFEFYIKIEPMENKIIYLLYIF